MWSKQIGLLIEDGLVIDTTYSDRTTYVSYIYNRVENYLTHGGTKLARFYLVVKIELLKTLKTYDENFYILKIHLKSQIKFWNLKI